MRFVFAAYVYSGEFRHPVAWLHRIRAYAGMLEALAAGHEVISIEQIDYEGEYAQNGVRYIFFRQPPGGNAVPLRLHRLIRSLCPDLVFIQGLHFPLQLIQLKLALGRDTRLLVQHHAEIPFRRAGKWAQRLADYGVDAYLFASRRIGMDWVKKGNLRSEEKIHEVMEVSSVFYPIDRKFARSKTGVSGDPVFLWVGRLNKNKDPLTVLRAWLAYNKHCPRAKLYMIYATDELLADLQEMLTTDPGRESVRLIGVVPNANLLYWYNSADYLISASYYEGSGTAVCEAMSCGCVPVLSDIDSFRTMTDDGRCGYLFEPGNAKALFRILLKLGKGDHAEKSKAALAFFRDRLSFPAIARRIQQIACSLSSVGPGFSAKDRSTEKLPRAKYEPVRGAEALDASNN